MIVPMTKYDFVLYHADVLPFLNKLQELGVVDARRSARPIDEQSSALMGEISRYADAYKLLGKINTHDPEPDDTQADHPLHLVRRTEELWAERGQMLDRKANLSLEVEVSRPWGNWGIEPIEKLKDLNIQAHFYKVEENRYNETWEQDYILKVVNRADGYIYFAVLEVPGESYNFPMSETRLPIASVEVLETELENIRLRLETIERKLAKYALQRERIAQYRNELVGRLDVYLSGKAAQAEADNTLAVITAFVPQSQNTLLVELLEKE